MDPTITVEDVLDLGSCYNRDKIERLAGIRKSAKLSEIMVMSNIPAYDRVWLAMRIDGWCRDKALDTIVCRAVRTYALTCGIANVERWAKAWLSGEDRTKSSIDNTFQYTESSIAVNAAVDAAYHTVDGEAPYAAQYAAYAVYRAARLDGSSVQYGNIVEIAEYERQVADILAVLKSCKQREKE